VGTHKKLAVSKQLQTHFKAKYEKGVRTPFPRVPAPLHPWQECQSWYIRHVYILVHFHVFVCSSLLRCMLEV